MSGKLLRLWQTYSLWSITIEGKVTWWSADDVHFRERKLDYEIGLPHWPWRLYCWRRGHSRHYQECVICHKRL